MQDVFLTRAENAALGLGNHFRQGVGLVHPCHALHKIALVPGLDVVGVEMLVHCKAELLGERMGEGERPAGHDLAGFSGNQGDEKLQLLGHVHEGGPDTLFFGQGHGRKHRIGPVAALEAVEEKEVPVLAVPHAEGHLAVGDAPHVLAADIVPEKIKTALRPNHREKAAGHPACSSFLSCLPGPAFSRLPAVCCDLCIFPVPQGPKAMSRACRAPCVLRKPDACGPCSPVGFVCLFQKCTVSLLRGYGFFRIVASLTVVFYTFFARPSSPSNRAQIARNAARRSPLRHPGRKNESGACFGPEWLRAKAGRPCPRSGPKDAG